MQPVMIWSVISDFGPLPPLKLRGVGLRRRLGRRPVGREYERSAPKKCSGAGMTPADGDGERMVEELELEEDLRPRS